MWLKKFIETITVSTAKYWSSFRSSVPSSANLRNGVQHADDFFEFSKHRTAYFTTMIQVMLAGYVGHLIANNKIQRELDKKDKTIEKLNAKIENLTSQHLSETNKTITSYQ